MTDRNIIRALVVETPSFPGNLGKVATSIGLSGGDIGDIETVKVGVATTLRTITVSCDDEEQLEQVVEGIRSLGDGICLHAVSDDVLRAHEGGKIRMKSRLDIRSLADLRRVYTPGVADVSREIHRNPEKSRHYTSIADTVAIVTDGTAILGLGDIGPVAGLPVMEGKAALFDRFVGISGVPILLSTQDPEEMIQTVKNISPGFGAILLEDISSPRCFEVEERLKRELDIPVMHDDQHGTAVVTLAAVITACKNAGVDLKNAVVGQIGLGAAGIAICRMLMDYGVRQVIGADKSEKAKERLSSLGGETVDGLDELMDRVDIVVATTGVPGLIQEEWVRKGQVILALSNPKPEIEPDVAERAGAAYAADGRSVNNLLGFPGIFRGALNANAKAITRQMLVAAATSIAECTKEGDLVPHPLDPQVHQAVARAVEKHA
ncbi:malate dehydrogenase (oxaloacetate-decarboxylating) [Kroppenstedtia sanguinis]|uniref:NAD-dependent malic enzyme n=1 Tax=Kroppenstedtia sanguinis TaxID=1380684 RepID=A0ABW4CBW8_9BACL